MTAGLDTRGRDAAAALRDLVADTIDDVDIDEAFEIVTGQRGRVVPLTSRSVTSRRRWMIAVASAAAAVMLVTTFVLRSGAEEQEPVTPPLTTIAVPFDPVLGVFEALGELDNGARFPVALPDGTVLVVGGAGADPPVLAFDPVTGAFTTIGSTTISPSDEPIPLVDGRVLLAGYSEVGGYGIELFDPTSGQSTLSGFSSGPPVTARVGHAAVQLADGRVLFVGGEPNGATATVDLFDFPGRTTDSTLPQGASGSHDLTGSMMRPRGEGVTATLLADGRVLVAGGSGVDQPDTTAELYDPRTGTFTETGPMSEPRSGHTATLLADGRVLFAGGYTGTDQSGLTTYLATNGDVYDPVTGMFAPTGPMQVPRWFHVAARLRDGRVLIAGGNGTEFHPEGITDAEIFDPATNHFSATGSMTSPRQNAGAAVLPNGDVLIVGTANFAGGPRPADDPTDIRAEIFR
jgi:hypothetical protein